MEIQPRPLDRIPTVVNNQRYVDVIFGIESGKLKKNPRKLFDRIIEILNDIYPAYSEHMSNLHDTNLRRGIYVTNCLRNGLRLPQSIGKLIVPDTQLTVLNDKYGIAGMRFDRMTRSDVVAISSMIMADRSGGARCQG